jgi:peptidoglycan/xylan/chitin deacetylase (PgdA/CDA1 family)
LHHSANPGIYLIMKKLILLLPLFLLISACNFMNAYEPGQLATQAFSQAATALALTAEVKNQAEPFTPTTLPSTPTLAAITPEPGQINPTENSTQVAFILPSGWQSIKTRMEAYGQVDPEQLSEVYINKVKALIAKYGKAKYITALEYHGDSYSMYKNAYSMDPATFKTQVETLMQQEYHFVTLHELEAFVHGQIDLPSRSIILTSDLSALNITSMTSITETFRELEGKYEYRPHMQVFIWAGDMQSDGNPNCVEDACWQTIRSAKDSGYFSFGSHSWSHSDASKWKIDITKADFEKANQAILENTGLNAYALAWPFESAYAYTDRLSESGFTLAFGGLTRLSGPQMVEPNDPTPMRLPRLLPPAISGVSMRPKGATLQQILDDQQQANTDQSNQDPSVEPAGQNIGTLAEKAKRVLVLEYHGIDFNMYEGAYAMNPETFASELDTLCQQGYSFLDLQSMHAFVENQADMPGNSIMLTSDVTIKSVGELPEISRLMAEAARNWGCQPHMNLFVVTDDMSPASNPACSGNNCWQLLQEAAAQPAYFSLGVHSASNLPFGQASPAWHVEDMAKAQKTMEEELGFKPTALSWPYEICPLDMAPYQELGFTLGFGGVTKALSENYVVAGDGAPLCLPRMLPPNLSGVSIRPQGLSFEEMLNQVQSPNE